MKNPYGRVSVLWKEKENFSLLCKWKPLCSLSCQQLQDYFPFAPTKKDQARKEALVFSVFRFWLFFRIVFLILCKTKSPIFGFDIAVCGFSVSSSMWFSVFVKNTSGFADPISVSFSYFLALISNGRETLKLYRSVSSHGTNSNMLRRAGTQSAQWDFQSKGRLRWTGTSWFGLEVPLCNLGDVWSAASRPAALRKWKTDQFRYIKIQPKTIDFSASTNSVFIPKSLVPRSIA